MGQVIKTIIVSVATYTLFSSMQIETNASR